MTYSYDFTREAASSKYIGLTEDYAGNVTHFFGPDSKPAIQKQLKQVTDNTTDETHLYPVDKAWRELFLDGNRDWKHPWFSRLPVKEHDQLELFYVIMELQARREEEEKSQSYEFAEALRKDWARVAYEYDKGIGEGHAKLPHFVVKFHDDGNESSLRLSLHFTKFDNLFKTSDPKKAAKTLKQISKLLSDLSG